MGGYMSHVTPGASLAAEWAGGRIGDRVYEIAILAAEHPEWDVEQDLMDALDKFHNALLREHHG